MKVNSKVALPLGIFFLVLLLILLKAHISRESDSTSLSRTSDFPIAFSFNGSSTRLKATEIIPTLETRVPTGKNVIWCASFVASWKAMEQNFAAGPVILAGNPPLAKSLNGTTDPRSFIPASAIYVAAGYKQDGIMNQIQTDLQRRFPGMQPPTFPGIRPDSFVAYSYLEAVVTFTVPYIQNTNPLVFTDGAGIETEISSFGIPAEDRNTHFALRGQPRILFKGNEIREAGGSTFDEFVIDLCSDSSPSQIIVAKVAAEETIVATLERIEKRISDWNAQLGAENTHMARSLQKLSSNDVLLIPDFNWFISHHFADLENKSFGNQKLVGQRLDVAQQDIMFRLDKNGAEIRAESKEYSKSAARRFVLDKPFLIYMKQRGAVLPYFAMWVDNAELMCQWSKKRESSQR